VVLQLIRYIIAGSINTIVGQSVVIAFFYLIPNVLLANIIGYSVGVTVSYFLNSYWVFASRQAMQIRAIPRFGFVIIISFLGNLATVYCMINSGVEYLLAQVSGAFIYTAISFGLFKLWVFKK